LAKGVAINVGVNTKREWGGFRGPIFSDGSFEFIHIPWVEEKYGMIETIEPRPRKYKEMPYASYVPESLQDRFLAESPNFRIKAYASSQGSRANKHILNLNPREDYLIFYATLRFHDEKGQKEDWINEEWGAYIVGLFKVDFVIPRNRVLFEEYAIEAFEEYDFYKILLNDPDPFIETPWVKGIEEESGLLKKAIPLNDPKDSHKWSDLAYELFTKSWKTKLDINKQANPRIALTCKGECLDKLLTKCILRKSNC